MIKRFVARFSSYASSSSTEATGSRKSFVKAVSGGQMSKVTDLVNDTSYELYLRDKVGSAYGGTRYKIAGHHTISIAPLQHTFFQMVIYAVEPTPDPEAGEQSSTQTDTEHPKKTVIVTNLNIDSDQLVDNAKIVISYDIASEKFSLQFYPR